MRGVVSGVAFTSGSDYHERSGSVVQNFGNDGRGRLEVRFCDGIGHRSVPGGRGGSGIGVVSVFGYVVSLGVLGSVEGT